MSTQNIFDLTDTWNAGGTTFTAIKMNVTDTASAAGSLLMDLQVGGVSRFSVRKDNLVTSAGSIFFASELQGGNTARIYGTTGEVRVRSAGAFQFSSDTTGFGSPDTILTRDAANTLAQRNGTNAQAFRVYGTFTDVSNYERAYIDFTASRLAIGNSAAGTGVQRDTRLQGAQIRFDVGSLGEPWQIASSGHFLCPTDNTYDIGASNATRPRNVHIAGYVSIGDGITAPGAGTGQARIYVDTADGDLKVIFADGTIKTIATDT
jgi:hypothetical protein